MAARGEFVGALGVGNAFGFQIVASEALFKAGFERLFDETLPSRLDGAFAQAPAIARRDQVVFVIVELGDLAGQSERLIDGGAKPRRPCGDVAAAVFAADDQETVRLDIGLGEVEDLGQSEPAKIGEFHDRLQIAVTLAGELVDEQIVIIEDVHFPRLFDVAADAFAGVKLDHVALIRPAEHGRHECELPVCGDFGRPTVHEFSDDAGGEAIDLDLAEQAAVPELRAEDALGIAFVVLACTNRF